jgi:nucleotide-binding universal stress UspA family protein
MKILVAIDGSPRAHATLESLVKRIDWFRERPTITLIYVHPPLPYGVAASWVGKDTVQRYYDEESDQVFAAARAFLDDKAIPHETVKKVGDPAHEIVSYASAGGADLVVMGTHGYTALTNLVMGSVATKVLASSNVPVLILR